jgi:uncharacterized protein
VTTPLSRLFRGLAGRRRGPRRRGQVLSDTARQLHDQAGRGHVAAQLLLGQALLDGIHMDRDPPQAVTWFTIGARAGYAPAMNMLGRCLERGWGCPADPPAASVWFRAAADKGDDWARYNLANMTLRGRGVPLDRPKAWRLFLAAAENGHAKSMNLVARFLEEGWDMPRDPAAAMAWYRRSAEAGDYRGRHNFATLLAERGHVTTALDWWGLALPDATPDILQAMRHALARLPPATLAQPAAAALLVQVTDRLARSPSEPHAGAGSGTGDRLVKRSRRQAKWLGDLDSNQG